jgi:uncharacterized protein YjbJ (UPF0337 family)
MNWDRIEGEWKHLTSNVKSKWTKLTDDDLKTFGAKKAALVGKIQERYGLVRDEAEKRVDEWIARLPPRTSQPRPEGLRDVTTKRPWLA